MSAAAKALGYFKTFFFGGGGGLRVYLCYLLNISEHETPSSKASRAVRYIE